jgi:hypothetical protein
MSRLLAEERLSVELGGLSSSINTEKGYDNPKYLVEILPRREDAAQPRLVRFIRTARIRPVACPIPSRIAQFPVGDEVHIS